MTDISHCPNCGQPAARRLHASDGTRDLRDCPAWVPGEGWRYEFGVANYEPCHDCGARLYLADPCVAVDCAVVCVPCGTARYGDQVCEYRIA